jgi:DNA-binding MarR family transcriptional regulator
MGPKRSEIDAAASGYRALVELLAGTRQPELPDSSVTMAQMRVLMLLRALGELSMSEAASALRVSQSTASGLVDRLVESGLVARHGDTNDRRQVIVSLTQAGVGFLDHFQEVGVSHLRELMATLPAEDLTTVRRAIDLLVAAAQELVTEQAR